jgi:hypothetical protein
MGSALKITKNKIFIAVIVICVLAAAWAYGGNYSKEAGGPEKNPVTEGATRAGEGESSSAGSVPENSPARAGEEYVFPAETGISSEDEVFSSSDLSSGNKEGRAAEPAAGPTEIIPAAVQGQPAGKQAGTGNATDIDAFAKDDTESKATGGKATTNTANPAGTNPQTNQGQHQPNSTPKGNPTAAKGQETTVNTEAGLTCKLSVACETILKNLDSFNKDKLELLPSDGTILPLGEVPFYEGESVFNLLQREMKKHKIHLEFSITPLYNTHYIEAINNIYEFDCGELSGWMYKVNGQFPGYSSSRYLLQDGDIVEWLYTCDLGHDLGQEGMGGNSR